MSLPPEIAAAELLRRRMARRGLLAFTRYTFPGYRPAPHHIQIAEALDAVERGEKKRLMIFTAPRHGKSELASRRFPAYFLGRNPGRQIIAASYNSDFAADFGREVRNILTSAEYQTLFKVSLSQDSKAANRWHTEQRGMYVAVGVGGATTGRGAHVLSIDDVTKDRAEADSELIRDKIWRWYTSTAYTRLESDIDQAEILEDDWLWRDLQRDIDAGNATPFEGAIIVTMCMTGDTPVLMADETEKPLRHIRPGDVIATYENGAISTSKVNKWKNNGPDFVFEIRTKSGTTVKANARHPFLVERDGVTEWRRTATLKRGDNILRVTGANGTTLSAAQMAATSQLNARGYANPTTVRNGGRMGGVPRLSILALAAKRAFGAITGSALRSMRGCLPSREAFAPFASNLQVKTFAPIGAANFVSTTATIALASEGFFATIATWLSVTERPQKFSKQQLNTYEITHDEIVGVVEIGYEDVFDIEVDRTENFIANGFISHNTRWHEDDLGGRLLRQQDEGGEQWEVIELPAVRMESDGERALWPAKFPLSRLRAIQKVIGSREWSALYQQAPAPDEGIYFKREHFRYYTEAPKHLRLYGASDYAVTDGGGDWTVHVVAGVDPDDNLYILDLWRQQTESNVWVDVFCDLVKKHKPLCWAEEAGQINKSLGPYIARTVREKKAYCMREQFPSVADKPTRARSFQARVATGKVYFPTLAPWMAELESEMLSFPAGVHDDQVDALALIGRMLDKMVGGRVPRQELLQPDRWRRAFERAEAVDSDWKVA